MLKEGENIVLFKLRIKNELKDLELNNPELIEEYKEHAIASIRGLVYGNRLSLEEAWSIRELIDPNANGGMTLEEAEKLEAEDEKRLLDNFLITIGFFILGGIWLYVEVFVL